MAVTREADLTGVSVLVVEDDPDAREMVQRLLEGRHAKVTAVSSGLEALAALEIHRPDVLVSDIAMRKLDGYAMLEEIRRREAERGSVFVPALALTAFDGTADMTRAGRAGYQQYLSKPFDPVKLIRTVAELAGRLPEEERPKR